MKIQKSTSSTSLEQLQAALKAPSLDAIPPGFKSSEQLSEEWGLKRSRTNDLLKEAVKRDLVEVVSLRVDGQHWSKYYKILCNKKPSK